MLCYPPKNQPFKDRYLLGLLILALGLMPVIVRAQTPKFSTDQIEFFEKEVRPLLSDHCYECHSASSEKLQAGLSVDSRAALIEGGDSGESIIPGDPDGSLFMDVVRWESYEMPPTGKLPDEDIETFAKWIRMGAPWPDEAPPVASDRRGAVDVFDLKQRKNTHWVWQPIENPAVPAVVRKDWANVDLDNFILAKLEEEKLAPSVDADRFALMRRLHQDIIGLPPTPEEARRFVTDDASDALERLVDTLLESPHFGERWGRHWLDLMRYAESRGHEFDGDAANAFQYRDYVIRAFNADVPYDQLIREHIAGDLLEDPRFNESILATGFWFLGEWVHSPVDIFKDESDRFDNMIDVMSKSFLGVTVSCARCHDHKFDAISTADYYSLTGFLQSSDFRQVRFDSIQHNGSVAKELAELDARYRQKIAMLLKEHRLSPPPGKPLPEIIRNSLVLDFGDPALKQLMQDGFIFGAPHCVGDAFLDVDDETPTVHFASHGHVVNDPAWNGLKSLSQKGSNSRNKLSELPRSGRTLRTPTFEVSDGTVACAVSGQGHVVACVDSHRQIAGPLHAETIQEIAKDASFVKLNLSRYKGHRVHLEFMPAVNERLEVAFVFQGTADLVKDGIKAFSEQEIEINAVDRDDFNTSVKEKCGSELNDLAWEWAKSRDQITARIVKRSRVAMAMMDGTGEDAHILIRGNSSKPGSVEPRHFLTAISGNAPMKIAAGSGRLELASQINDPDNPLTARVIVNRIWHYLMGRGIVPTPDDFGVLGQRPTHPKLLDHLATKFLNDGRSIKRMIRHIVLSRTYQMSCKSDAVAIEVDPKNLLWHHRPPKRLEGEAIRDSLLFVSGNLDDTMFGDPIPIHLTSFMQGRGKPKKSGPLDGDRRRSIYIEIRRNFLSPFMLTFDTPTPFSTMGRRNVSNVPAQALTLMNDPFVVQQALDWSRQAIEHCDEPQRRIEWMYMTAFCREPSDRELKLGLEFIGDEDNLDRWSAFAHALVNTKEFIFLK